MIKITAPSTLAEPITVEEARAHLRIDTTNNDMMLRQYIIIARQQCENRTKRVLRPSTVVMTLDDLTSSMELPYLPLRDTSALTITYNNSSGGVSTLASTIYSVHNDSDNIPPQITTAYGQSWPSYRAEQGAITITYRAGYVTPSEIPTPLKLWMLLYIGAMDWYRELYQSAPSGRIEETPFAQGLLDPYIVHSIR